LSGPGFCDISVTVPNNDNTLSFQAHGVSKIILNTELKHENISFVMNGGSNAGYITIKVNKVDSKGNFVMEAANLTFGMSQSSFGSALNIFSSFKSYSYTVTQTMNDSSNVTTTNIANAARI
jgi:hypothetical protein